MSAPNGNGNGKPDAPEKIPCRACKALLGPGQYKKLADGVICRDQPSCRQRVLGAELGIDLFTRYPRERLLYEMDCRPENYKKIGWETIFTEDERVMAAWIYYSWCYPIGLKYAVQIDADDEIMHDRYAKPMVMDQVRLGKILGIPQPNISRATNRLADRKKLQIDDGMVYPVAKPAISLEDRAHISTDIHAALGEDPDTIPKKYRHLLNDLLSEAPENISTDMLGEVLALCSAFNEGLKDIRTARDFGIEQVCTRLASLLSRPVTFKKAKPAAPSPPPKAPPSIPDEVRGVKPTPVNELYAAGLGKGALAKLPSPRPVIETTTTPVVVVVEKCDDDEKDLSDQKTTVPDFGQQVIAAFVAGGKPSPTAKQIRQLEQAIPDNPEARAGFVPFLEEKMPRTKHPGLLPNVAEEFNAAWPALMEREKAIRESARRREPSAPFTVEDLRYHLEAVAAAVPYPAIAESLVILAANAEKHYADLENLETRLTVLEEKMLEIGRAGLTKEQADEVSKGVELQLKPYRGKMTSSQLATLEAQYRERSVFEKAKLPRLSLFYMREKAQGAGQ